MDVSSLLVFMMLEALAVICEVQPGGRILGGYPASPYSIKYMVAVRTLWGQHLCGGSLINKYWVITAAHCNIGAKNMMIVAGEYSLTIYEGTEQYASIHLLIPHPKFNPSTNDNDIMLVKLSDAIKINPFVSIGLLPRHDAFIAEGRLCQVSGWGFTSLTASELPSLLHTVKIPIFSNEKCNSSESFNGMITDNMVCAGYQDAGKDACLGDSGGPLVCEGRIYGLVSWGKGCGYPQYPGVYTAVSKFRRWIDKNIFSYYGKCKEHF
ncbi:trypsin [Thalassophryne amazonica]|uniref:trypsin n=1 Tax=Thalassophryne amazonica TaxID=390379 RepID=UPI001471383A|nr:trypsin [Thalassophryne amazonica]